MERKLLWDVNYAKAKTFHYLIAEMIASDNEPLSIVERVGFTRLMEKALPRYKRPNCTYIADKIMPDIYDRINAKIEADISKTTTLSVTSDIWTCLHNASFLSFTAHWLSPEFKPEHAVLAMKPFPGSHIGGNMAIQTDIKFLANLLQNIFQRLAAVFKEQDFFLRQVLCTKISVAVYYPLMLNDLC